MRPKMALPNGDTTTLNATYVKAWREYAAKVASFFPGYEVHSYDPGVTLATPGQPLLSLSAHEVKSLLGLGVARPAPKVEGMPKGVGGRGVLVRDSSGNWLPHEVCRYTERGFTAVCPTDPTEEQEYLLNAGYGVNWIWDTDARPSTGEIVKTNLKPRSFSVTRRLKSPKGAKVTITDETLAKARKAP
jgi:hypothetical protein